MNKILFIFSLIFLIGCKENSNAQKEEPVVLWERYNDSIEVVESQANTNPRMKYKLVQSKYLDKNDVFLPLYNEVQKLSDADYQRLKPIVFEKNMLELRSLIEKGELKYEELVLFYLYRIYKYELNNETTLNTILALNSKVVEQARKLDELKASGNESSIKHPIYGMPILLKDNINTKGMNTTAGSVALMNNKVEDAFIVKKLKENGALILGKANLSEWAYFMCSGCPVGYSAVGGQTLNPYGRKIFETGGCLQAFPLSQPSLPDSPEFCQQRHGWVLVGEQNQFWNPLREFTVVLGQNEIAVCTISPCRIRLVEDLVDDRPIVPTPAPVTTTASVR